MLKGCHSNTAGTTRILLFMVGMAVHMSGIGEPSSMGSVDSGPQSPGHVLVAPTMGANLASQPATSTTPVETATVRYSYQIGPFNDVEQMNRVVSFLERDGMRVNYSEKTGRQALGYIVVSRRFDSTADIRQLMDELTERGVGDVVYVRVGDYEGRVSMGVYSTEANAKLRQMTLQGMGFAVEVIQRSKTISQWWIHLVAELDQDQLLAQVQNMVAPVQLSIERQEEVIPAVVEAVPVAEVAPEPDTSQAVTAPEPDDRVPAEAVVPSLPVGKDNVSTPAPPIPRDIRLPPAEQGLPWSWLVAGFLLLVSCTLIWYVFRRRSAQQKNALSPLTALVSSTLNERSEGILVLDDNQFIVLANKAFSRLVGKSSEELMGQNIAALAAYGEDVEARKTPWGSILDKAAPGENVRLHLQLANSNYSTFLASTSPLLTEQGERSGTIVGFNQILELNDARSSTDAIDQAEIYRWAGSEFLQRISPENQAPVQAILKYAEFLSQRRQLDPVEEEELLSAISADGSRVVNLLGKILELSKHHSGLFTIEKVTFSPLSLIQELFVACKEVASEQGINLVLEGEENLPETIVSDPGKIGRIIQYILLDALQRTNEGDVILKIVPTDSHGADELELEIADHSNSLTDTSTKDIYHFLERLAFESAEGANGHELDLVIARHLVDQLGGELRATALNAGSVCFGLSIPVTVVEAADSIAARKDEQLMREQLLRAEALAEQEAASRISAEEQASQERDAKDKAEADAKRATEARMEAEERAAREAEQKQLLKQQLAAKEQAHRELEEQAKTESAAKSSIEVDLLEAARHRDQLLADIEVEKKKRGEISARNVAEAQARKEAEQLLQAALESARQREDELAASNAAEAMARKDAEQRLAAERKSLVELQNQLNRELEARQALEARGREEAEVRSKIETSLTRERAARKELEDKLKEQGDAGQALSIKIEAESRALAEIESKLGVERQARAELEATLSRESSGKQELAAKVRMEAEARELAEQSLIAEREEKQSLHNQLEAEARARQELSERIQAEERARETAQRALEGKRETVLELEEKLRIEAAATAELLLRTRSEAEARRALGQQLEEEQQARARLESTPKFDPELQAKLDQAVSKNSELEQTVRTEEAARVMAEQNLALEMNARKTAETRMESEQQLNAAAQTALEEERQARRAAEEKVREEEQSTSAVQQPGAETEIPVLHAEIPAPEVEQPEAVTEEPHIEVEQPAAEVEAPEITDETPEVEVGQPKIVIEEESVEVEQQAVEQVQPVPRPSLPDDSDEVATDSTSDTGTAMPFAIVADSGAEEPIDESIPPLLTDRLEVAENPDESEDEFTGDKSERPDFVGRLGEQLVVLESQWEQQDLTGFALTLKWVCEFTELFDFRDLVSNAKELSDVIDAEAFGMVPTKLRYLKRLYARIEGGKATSFSDSIVAEKAVIASKKSATENRNEPRSKRAAAGESVQPVRSSLNLSNPTIQRLVKRSTIRLNELLTKMELCFQDEDFKELVKHCYRLRGEADIAGLKAFISPARQLEQYVSTGQINRVEKQLLQLRELHDRIELSDQGATGKQPDMPLSTDNISQETVDMETITSGLNLDNPKLKARVQQFVVRLGSQLTELSEAARQQNYDEMVRISTWIVNYGRVMGFEVISELAESLLEMAETRSDPEISDQLEQLRMIFSRVEI